jgi:NhaP-type Na+/H+ or K+/H+ antiporter
VAFRSPVKLTELAESRHGFVAVAATLLAYGLAEIAQGYGFLAVFVAAVALRSSERRHEYHGVLHTFADEAEQLVVVGLLLLFGGALAGGLLDHVTWQMGALAAVILLVLRPLSGVIALAGSNLGAEQRWAIAFFGVRGIGSLYYLAYADSSYDFGRIDALWTVTALVMLGSVVLHGLTATPVMRRLDLHRLARMERRRVRRTPPAGTPST